MHPVRRAVLAGAAAVALGAAALAATGTADASGPAASRADLISYLSGISGHYTLSGQEDGPNSAPATWQNKVHDITGVYPAVWGGDFAFEQADVDARQTVIDQAVTEWNSGSLPALMWHACPPTVGSTCHWDYGDGAIESHLTDDQWNELVTDGTPLNQAWKARLDEVVPYFQQLKDDGIPVLFRPLHEMNDGWSWWGGRPGPNGSSKLYQITHDYLTGQGLDNIVWVWNVKDVGTPEEAADYYPGDDYVDVVSLDPYVDGFPTQAWHDELRSLAGDKPMALAEVQPIPSPDQLAQQPDWTYFSIWINFLTDNNSDDAIKATYYDPQVLHQGQLGIG
jgi:mannan endo-1,4-beta-mannosidase